MTTTLNNNPAAKKATSQSHQPSVGFVSLGCPKALVDSEQAISHLRMAGYQIRGDYNSADVVVVNTCGFIESAEQESLDAIGEAIAMHGRVIVTGCLGVKAEKIRQAHPQVLAITGPHDHVGVIAAVQAHLPLKPLPFEAIPGQTRAKVSKNKGIDLPEHGIKLTPPHYAYIKIAEGCDHHCRFCIIPSMRGGLVSRPLADIEREVTSLIQHGCRELLIVAQDTAAYGLDWTLENRQNQGIKPSLRYPIVAMVDAIAAIIDKINPQLAPENRVWQRLHYLYPYAHVDSLVERMAQGKVLPYLDIPFQHINARVLKAMQRPAYRQQNPRRGLPLKHSEVMLARLQKWREKCPELVIRSTFIVGFPGETEEEFEELLSFIAEAQLDRVGCFTYSAIEGASANALPNPVPEPIKLERQERLMKLQEKISHANLKKKLGRSMIAVVEDKEYHEDTNGHQNKAPTVKRLIARSGFDAPDIDGLIFVEANKKAHSDLLSAINVGDRIRVKVLKNDAHDLYALFEERLLTPVYNPSPATTKNPKKINIPIFTA